tara:strand:+ start:49 stop:591 length:543 start_codon:yes stop_codon:yes gene_type:complete
MKYKVKNIADKINLEPFYIFAKNLSSIRTLKPDLSTNPDVIKITKNYYNEHNNCNYIAFADEKDVKHLPWAEFDSVFNLEKKSFCFINQPPGMFTNPHYDSFFGYCQKNKINDQKASKVERYVVFLNNWQWGQSFCFPDHTFTNWRLGDVLTWPYLTWHSTANAGIENRLIITVTGVKSG